MADPRFMNRLQNGLLGTPENYGGLLAQEELDRARNQGLMSFGASLLQAGGPSAMPTRLGPALGNAIMQGRGAQHQSSQGQLQSLLLRSQLDQMARSKKGELVSVIGEDGNPKYVYAADAIGKTPFNQGNGAKDAASIQEYNLYYKQAIDAGKKPLQFDEFLRLRTDQVTQSRSSVQDVGAVPTLVTTTGPKMGATQPLSTLPKEAAGKSMVAGAIENAKTTEEKTATAAFDLPRVEQNAKQAIDTLSKLEIHPGLKYITGGYSLAPVVPGTQQAAADALAKQVEGQNFLQAYQALKGGGQITEIEGKKGEAAIARLQRKQSESDYKSALKDLREVIESGVRKSEQQARKTPAQESSVKRVRVDAQGNVIGN